MNEDEEMALKDCPWCGLPMDLVRVWTKDEEEMACAKCWSATPHWYGGRLSHLVK